MRCRNCNTDIRKISGKWYHNNGMWLCSFRHAEPRPPESEMVTCREKDGSLGCSHHKNDECDCECHKMSKPEKVKS